MPAPPPPSEQPAKCKTPYRAALALAFLLTCGLLGYTALHPVRLLSQASYLGKAPKSLQRGDDPAPVADDSCGCQYDSESVIDRDGISFPDGALLSDGRRRVVLNVPKLPKSGNAKGNTAAGSLILFSADAPDQRVTFVGVTPPEMRSLVGVTPDHRIIGASVVPLPDSATSIASPRASEVPAEVALFRFGIMENRSPVERLVIRAPAVGAVREMALSPAGDRILWVIRYARRPYSGVTWAARHVSLLGRYAMTRQAISVWTTDLLGRDPIRIGEEAASTTGQNSLPLPAHFTWTTDRRQIQFVYGSSFFAVHDPRS